MQVDNSTRIMLGIGDYGATATPGGVIRTMALGSCIALMILDRKTHCISMAHIALPDSSAAMERALLRPGYYVDTGLPALLDALKKVNGSEPKLSDLIVKIAGGANVADPNNVFNIGKRNVLAARQALWQIGLGPIAEDVGGNHSRTVTLYQNTGRIILSSPSRPDWEL